MIDTVEKFINELTASLKNGTFVKLTLGNYKGVDPQLQKILVRLVGTKKGTRLFFLYRSATRDTAKNYDLDTGTAMIAEALDGEFFSGHLFTTANDFQLEIGRKGKSRLNVSKPTFKTTPAIDHNREKTVQIASDSFYLKALGITDDNGRVRDNQQDKWRQINKYVEVLASLVDKSDLKDRRELKMIDMGAGKGYLTFAAYDHFANVRGLNVTITGVDTNAQLAETCNSIAAAAGFDGLKFEVGSIANYEVGGVDVLIALHACNTATDDALYKGIAAGASLIVAAPCCHQELRQQLEAPAKMRDILKHGIMAERIAETLTDGLRSLLLERSGYSTKLFEFVAVEHTPKNNMLVATHTAKPTDRQRYDDQINALFTEFGIHHQRLYDLLSTQVPPQTDSPA